jgi:hypothetical protein
MISRLGCHSRVREFDSSSTVFALLVVIGSENCIWVDGKVPRFQFFFSLVADSELAAIR